jgi:hypothetical protein
VALTGEPSALAFLAETITRSTNDSARVGPAPGVCSRPWPPRRTRSAESHGPWLARQLGDQRTGTDTSFTRMITSYGPDPVLRNNSRTRGSQ